MPPTSRAHNALQHRLSSLRGAKMARRMDLQNTTFSISFSSQKSETASIYSYGKGFLGSLGTSSYEDVQVPTAIMVNKSIKSISSGWAHAGFITDDGDAYLYGRSHSFKDVLRATNMYRIAPWLVHSINGLTKRMSIDTLAPGRIELSNDESMERIFCSTALSFILTKSGKVYSTGANAYGQCGIGTESFTVHKPQRVVFPGEEGNQNEIIVDVAAGYQHGIALTENGRVYTWGKGERGQLGYGTANTKRPQQVIALQNQRVTKISAGFNTSCALTANGELFVWGKLLGLNGMDSENIDQVTPRRVSTMERVTQMESSHFHTAFITEDGNAWILGRTPTVHRHQDRLTRIASTMHSVPFKVSAEDILPSMKDVCKLGKGVHRTSFITTDGKVFDWTFEKGFGENRLVSGLHVLAYESGYQSSLLLGVPRT